MNKLPIIGRAERVDFPTLGVKSAPAKIDTGADVSSIWASRVTRNELGTLKVVFFGPGSPFYDGKEYIFLRPNYAKSRVTSSFGDKEIRYKVKLRVRVKNRLIKGTFTLADRGGKTYPILIGRRLLNRKFIVDVNQGGDFREKK